MTEDDWIVLSLIFGLIAVIALCAAFYGSGYIEGQTDGRRQMIMEHKEMM